MQLENAQKIEFINANSSFVLKTAINHFRKKITKIEVVLPVTLCKPINEKPSKNLKKTHVFTRFVEENKKAICPP